MKELVFAIIKWQDAAENNSVEHDRMYLPIPILLTYTSGHVVYEDDEMITIARDYFPAPSEEHEDTVRKKLTIPKSNIKLMKKFKVNSDLE